LVSIDVVPRYRNRIDARQARGDVVIRVISFVTLTDKGAREIGTFADTVAEVRRSVTRNGGTLEHAWQTAGIYDFVVVESFPDLEAEFRARNEVYRLGTIRADHVPAIPIEQALQLVGT
jgi:uncharacterized protein with GYD domain